MLESGSAHKRRHFGILKGIIGTILGEQKLCQNTETGQGRHKRQAPKAALWIWYLIPIFRGVQCAEMFSVSLQTIIKIKNNLSWKGLPDFSFTYSKMKIFAIMMYMYKLFVTTVII